MAEKLRTLIDLIESIPERGDNPAIFWFHRKTMETWSYAELADRVHDLAQRLSGTGVGNGQAIALSSDNRPEWIVACLAVAKAGGLVVPVDVQLADDTFRHVLKDSGATFAFVTADGAERLQHVAPEGKVRPVLLDSEDNELSWRNLPEGNLSDRPPVDASEPATLFYTSGTTGPPKGVPLSHANLVFQLNAIIAEGIVTERDRLLLPLPLHHVYPFVFGMLAPLALGLPIIMPRALTGSQVATAMRQGDATLIIGVPRLYRAFDESVRARFEAGGRLTAGVYRAGVAAATWSRRRLGLRPGRILRPLHRRIAPDLRLLVSGGAALDPDLAWRLEGLGWQVASGYGLTETSPMLTWNIPGRAKLDSGGKPVPGIELRIEPATTGGQGAPSDEAAGRRLGEILARGPGVFAGYRNLPDKTAEDLTDGWFHTGDLGYFDDEGYLHIAGRVKTMIVTESGENVQPGTVEEAYLASPAIREIGVLQKDGRLVAVIVPEASAIGRGESIEKAIGEALRVRAKDLPSYQRLSDYAVTREPLPRTRLGKLRRHLLEERFDRAKTGEEPGAPAAAPVRPEEMSAEDQMLLRERAPREIWNWLAGRYSNRRLTPDDSLQLDLGVDSMEWLTLTLEIGRRVGVELPEEAIARIETVRDLLSEVAEASEAGERFETSVLEDPEAHIRPEQLRWLEPIGPSAARIATGLYVINRALMRRMFRLQVEGRERLPEAQAMFAPTHGSLLDPFVIAAALDRDRLTRTYWAGDVTMAFGNPLTRSVSRLAQAVPIDAERGFVAGMAIAAAVLQRGGSLIWFPEGRRATDGEVQEFMPGVGVLLEHFPVPIVPVVIHGAHEAFPPGRLLPRPGQVVVTFGDPVNPATLERQGEGDQPAERITNALYRRVSDLYRRTRATSA